MKTNLNEHKEDPLRNLKIAGVVAVSFWLGNLVFGITTATCGEFGSRLGDSFGAVSALFSSAAVAGAIYAVILQQREYHDAKEQACKSEKHQQSLAEVEALSAYSQCLAACAQNVANKAAASESRFLEMIRSGIPDAKKIGITEVDVYQKYVDDMLEQQHRLAENMLNYSQRANDLMVDLLAILEHMRKLPIISRAISQSPDPDGTPMSDPKEAQDF